MRYSLLIRYEQIWQMAFYVGMILNIKVLMMDAG